MLKYMYTSVSMIANELICTFDKLFHDSTENTYTNLNVLCYDGSATCLHVQVKDLSLKSEFERCFIRVNNSRMFYLPKNLKKNLRYM